MRIIKDIREMQKFGNENRQSGKTIGFVPTMGYLHEGHVSLIKLMRQKCDVLVVSIFVNPAQFGPNEDFEAYPRDFQRDEELCKEEKVDIIFYPDAEQMYRKPYLTHINVEKITETMCGISRPGHFQGVATVVGKLFNIVKPHYAIFGKKDYQQAVVIKQMVKDLNFDVEILTGPIVREKDGLAMSSRNKYLSEKDRKKALILNKSLHVARNLYEEGISSPGMVKMQMEQYIRNEEGVVIDYIAIVDAEDLKPVKEIDKNTLIALAVYVGDTRLIDNIIIGR
ncbi:MAG: pantoate--beta-alanine ligase [Calditrichia bacterium]